MAWLLVACLSWGKWGLAEDALPAAATKRVDYAQDVQPILSRHCYKCHGPEKQESSFRLDQKAAALRGGDWGDKPFLSGKSAESPLIKAIAGQLPDLKMPPEGERLTGEEIGILRAWIDQGISWPESGDPTAGKLTTDHWSFQSLKRTLPKSLGDPRVSSTIDGFVLDTLQEKNLALSPPADRVTLLRRLSLDLLGLPPTPEEVAAFLQDEQADAYERLVDRLLASPRQGERWARHWLDVVRFAETNGFETNTPRPDAYQYRDYVIRALNADLPYDQFVRDQLVGDATGADAATGFLVGGAFDQVKSPDINLTLMQRQDELADMVSVTGMTFLGLTTGCARCHNHKFDPITQQDYYSLQAVFAGVQHGNRPLRTPEQKNHEAELLALQKRQSEVEAELSTLERSHEPLALTGSAIKSDRLRAPVNARINSERFTPVRARFVRFTIEGTNGAEPCLDELEIFAATNEKNDVGEKPAAVAVNLALASAGAKLTSSGDLAGFPIHKLEHLIDGQYGNGRSWISSTAGTGWVMVELPQPAWIDRIVWGRDREGKYPDRLATNYKIEVAEKPDQWQLVAGSADRIPFGMATISSERFAGLPPELQTQAKTLAAQSTQLTQQIQSLRTTAVAYAGTFVQPGPTHRLYRGDPLAKREEVPPDALLVIGSLKLPADAPEQARRVALADWLLREDNPLPPRVMANRLWQHHFGTGIAATPSDLGKNGIPPSHPLLLDWLASELRRGDWSLKGLHRRIVNSATYRQASQPTEKGLALDAGTRLLWRYPPRRLEAETVRDSVLAVTGSLDLAQHGPGFTVFLPNDNYVRVYKPKETWTKDEWRRMIYMVKVRMEQDPVFGALDCPDAGQAAPKRSRSTTAIQALNLFNSTFMLQQADLLAQTVRGQAGDQPAAHVRRLFWLAFSRSPTPVEEELSVALVQAEGLPTLCRAVLNANEFVFLP